MSTEKIVLVVQSAIKQRSLEEEVRSLRERMSVRYRLIGESEPVRRSRCRSRAIRWRRRC